MSEQQEFYSTDGLTMAEYQAAAARTNMHTLCNGSVLPYLTMGLCGEAGEFANKVKKIFRDEEGYISPETAVALKKELGGVLWYLSQAASAVGCTLEDVGWANIQQLESRKQRGVIGGSGDNR